MEKIEKQELLGDIRTIVRTEVREVVRDEVQKAVGPAVDKAVAKAVGPAVEKAVKEEVPKAVRHEMGLFRSESNDNLKREMGLLRNESNDNLKHEIGLFREEVNDKFKVVAEQFHGVHSKMDRMQTTLDGHTEMIGALAVDMQIVKEDVTSIKSTLETKADAKDLKTLRDVLGF